MTGSPAPGSPAPGSPAPGSPAPGLPAPGEPAISREQFEHERAARIAAETLLARRSHELECANTALIAETERLRAAILQADTARLQETVALEETSALFRTLDALVAAPDEAAAIRALVAEVAAVFQSGPVLLLTGEDRGARVVGASEPALAGLLLPVDPAWLGRERRMADMRRGAGAALAEGPLAGQRALVSVPVAVSGASRIALVALAPEAGAFGVRHLRLLGRIARISAQALETMRQSSRSRALAAVIGGDMAESAGAEADSLLDAPFAAVNRALDRLTKAQALVLDILTQLLQAHPDDVDRAIDQALARLGAFTGSDRTYVFRVRDERVFDNTHEWCADGIAPMIAELQDCPIDIVAHWLPEMRAGRPIYVPDVLDFEPGSPERELLGMQGIRSLLIVPMVAGGRLTGFAGLDSVLAPRSYLPGEVLVLRSLANAIDKVMNARDATRQLEAAMAALGNERARLAATLEAMPDLVIELDAGGVVTGFHSASTEASGAALAGLKGRRLCAALAPEDAGRVEAALTSMAAGGDPAQVEFGLDLGRGQRWFEARAASRQGDEGVMAGCVVVLRDMTLARWQTRELARLSEIARRTTNLVVITDAERRIVWVNPAFEARTGYPLAEVIGKSPGKLLQCPETDEAELARLRVALDRGEPVTAELVNRDRWGGRYWVELAIQPLHDEAGALTGFMGMQSDITERKAHAAALARAAAEAEQARRTLEAGVSALDDGFAYYDSDDRLVLCNARYREAWPGNEHLCEPGMAFETLLRADLALGGTLDAIGREEAFLADVLARRSQPESTNEVQNADGRWLRIFARQTPDGGCVESIVDVTRLKEVAVRALEERAAALDASRDGIALTDAEGAFLYMNPAHLAMFAFASNDEIRGLNWRSLYDPDQARLMEREAMRAVDGRGGWRGEVTGRARSGAPVEQEVSLTRRPDGGLLWITRDISDRRRAEAERTRLAAELERAQRREMIGQMAAGLAHDFNNLLATISGSASLAEAALPADHAAAPHALRILSASDQATGLVRRLLNLGKRQSNPARIDLRAPLREAVDLARAGLPASVQLTLEMPDEPCEAEADATEMVQIVLNLVLNARDAMLPAGGEVRVSIGPERGADGGVSVGHVADGQRCWCLSVVDDGPGMPEDVAKSAFRPYFTTKGADGSGLGLAIVKSLVTGAGGAVRLVTAPGEGTRFDILWPLLAGAVAAPPPSPAAGGALAGRRVMVVDDSEALLEVLKAFLKSAGASVATATDPEHAIEALADSPDAWDLVITDFDMPGLTGAEVARAAAATAPGVPVILLTALPEWQARDRDARFAAVLGKPVTSKTLISAAVSVLDGRR